MKHRFITPALVLFSMLLWTSSRAHGDPLQDDHQRIYVPSEKNSASLTEPDFDIRLCLSVFFVNVCFTLHCDLHWTDVIQPGFGQLLGHDGCKIIGMAADGDGHDYSFEGNAEDMIQAVEKAMQVPHGSLKIFDVLESPTFPLPDGKDYRVVVKKYPVLQGSGGRYLPLEVEAVQ